ncbi:hypothetical protein BDZ97DRAFT_1929187 [Flammula alnicola]|nr:hypothetical protein BDZ97DRAFT_1929187 [Flammula alnicola]
MSSLTSLLSLLSVNPSLSSILDIQGCITFLELVQLLKPTIQLSQAPGETAPIDHLPVGVHTFLSKCLAIDDEGMKHLWRDLRFVAWEKDLNPADIQPFGARYLQLFLDYGESNGIAFYHFMPPVRTCIDPRCSQKVPGAPSVKLDRQLVEALTFPVTVFTKDFGAIPGLSTSTYCRECHTRYRHNYYIHSQASLRTYYRGPFEFLHVAEHVFLETRVCELFTSMMLTSWTSATNCARIYNDGLSSKSIAPFLPVAHTKTLALDAENVWDGLFLYWLLEDCYERDGETLELSHDKTSQENRLQPAMAARTRRLAGPGRDDWNHACDLCCAINVEADGTKTYLRSCVTDGVTIGHPCCAEHDCTVPLESVKHRYCPLHKAQDKLCSVISCSAPAEDKHKTCSLPEHRKLEDYNELQNKAMFKLKERLRRARAQPRDAIPSYDHPTAAPHVDEELLIDANGICNGKPETGNTTVRARFGRRRTHNEELCVASCGVILGRTTFYGSEVPNGVRVSSQLLHQHLSLKLSNQDILDASLPYKEIITSCAMA